MKSFLRVKNAMPEFEVIYTSGFIFDMKLSGAAHWQYFQDGVAAEKKSSSGNSMQVAFSAKHLTSGRFLCQFTLDKYTYLSDKG